MKDTGSVGTADEQSMLGLGESVHSSGQRLAAVVVCLALIEVALLAIRFGSVQGPEVKPFLPVVTTIWALADLMTAFLLLAQFYVNGTTFFTVLAAGYALSGLLTWPYLYAFPGIFNASALSVPEQQIPFGSGPCGMPPFRLSSPRASCLTPNSSSARTRVDPPGTSC